MGIELCMRLRLEYFISSELIPTAIFFHTLKHMDLKEEKIPQGVLIF